MPSRHPTWRCLPNDTKLIMSSRPNIIVVLCDQLRRSALGCYGDPDAHTPNIDKLAAQGVTFNNASSTCPVCVPFRFSMMTGQYAHSRAVPSIHWRMSPAEHTLADAFNQAQYDTMYVGKWHLAGGTGPFGFKQPVARPYRGAWKTWRGFELRNNYFDTVYFEDDSPAPIPIKGYQTDGLFNVATDLLDQRSPQSDPFFMVLSVEAPHPPYEAPEPLLNQWLEHDLTLPPNFMRPDVHDPLAGPRGQPFAADKREHVLRRRKIYYAMLQNLDENVGRLMDKIQESQLSKNTIVVFLSDHGELGGAHALEEKQYPFEESNGIPLIAWGPGCEIAQGARIPIPTCTEDIYPTLLGLAGLNTKSNSPETPGYNLVSLLQNPTHKINRPGVMLEFIHEHREIFPFYKRGYRGFRSERYKYTSLISAENGKLVPWQFYDLQNDPYEMHNLIDDDASSAMIAQHQTWLTQRMVATHDDLRLL